MSTLLLLFALLLGQQPIGLPPNQAVLGINYNAGIVKLSTGRVVAQSAAVANLCSFTPASDMTLLVTSNVLITTSTTFSFTVNTVYTDEGNTGRTISHAFGAASGFAIGAAAITNGNGAAPYLGLPETIRAKGGTTVNISTAGTFTTVTYNFQCAIFQILDGL